MFSQTSVFAQKAFKTKIRKMLGIELSELRGLSDLLNLWNILADVVSWEMKNVRLLESNVTNVRTFRNVKSFNFYPNLYLEIFFLPLNSDRFVEIVK